METAYPQTVAEAIAFQVEQQPNAVAIMGPGYTGLSYHGLFTQVDRVASSLRSMGIDRGDRVAIVISNGPRMAVAFLSTSACATSVPLNPDYNADEFNKFLSLLNVKALMLESGFDSPAREVAGEFGIAIIELLPSKEPIAGLFTIERGQVLSQEQPELAKPDEVALVLPTSGTVSQPKVVPLSQENICVAAGNIGKTLRLGKDDRCLNVMPLFHVHGLIATTLASISSGGSVVYTPRFESSEFFTWLDEFHPTWYSAVPTIHQAILASMTNTGRSSRSPSLRFIRSATSAMSKKTLQQLEQAFGVPVIESYGMTEAATQITSNPLPPKRRIPGSVGLPAGPQIAIIDEGGRRLKSGEIGEIVIRGVNVVTSYENDPNANKTGFINGWLRTGDLGFMNSDNYLFITGRLKEIINRGGFKVSPREIDEAITDHPDVCQAMAFALPHETLGEDIAVAVVLKNNASLTEQGLREFAFDRLADYKVPSRVLFVDLIPKGPTGKPQRIGLADRFSSQLRSKFVAPGNEWEQAVAKIVAEVLGIEGLGVHDNIFSLGGDSLHAIKIISRVNDTYAVNLPISALFRKPTVAELAAELAHSKKGGKRSTLMNG